MSEEPPSAIGDLRYLQTEPETISGAAWRTVADLKADVASPAGPAVARSDETKQPRIKVVRAAWLPLIALIYGLSSVPAFIAVSWVAYLGIDLLPVYQLVYWPVLEIPVEFRHSVEQWLAPVLPPL